MQGLLEVGRVLGPRLLLPQLVLRDAIVVVDRIAVIAFHLVAPEPASVLDIAQRMASAINLILQLEPPQRI
eukprot:2908545-Rhodomonas_salina.1